MHSTGVVIASLIVTTASVVGVIDSSADWIVLLLAVGVALIGVPHGGLDHFTGRALLANRFPKRWPFVFFPIYLSIALVVASGWFLLPATTAVAFFLLSAWHFGQEDECPEFSSRTFSLASMLAIGGMVIWIPMLTRGGEVENILAAIIPDGLAISASQIVVAASCIAWTLMPVLVVAIGSDLAGRSPARGIRNATFAILFANASVLISFGIYFCVWHSVRGLHRLAKTHRLSATELLIATAPMSMAAIAMAAAGMWFWSSGQTAPAAMQRTVFVALSAMAVPHLVLHGPITEFAIRRTLDKRLRTTGKEALA